MSKYFVIFGAAVLPDGRPSGTLVRRVQGALALARDVPDRVFLATGGVGRYGTAEAHLSRKLLLAAGAEPQEILIEDQAADTLQSALFCDTILRLRGDVDQLVICTSTYHIPRCALLFSILGYPVRIGRMPSDLPHVGLRKWIVCVLKECLATPYDASLLLTRILAGTICRSHARARRPASQGRRSR